MKKLAIALLATVALLSTTSAPSQAQYVWTCEAHLPVAYGVGISSNPMLACNRALIQCGLRTPYWMTCHAGHPY